ncbi:hypothetical protein DDE82_002574 [Stemphylium lycopersici]|uniref:Uncharacterized protein n=1 Tax=Stemphylium lycopersici TaxID=183478 RepID=A0A364NCW1_STELY|nr:hypothetical protein DDE82_002574 [Stemphylium lycopersici]RAR15096.1 hypothetical protein DDE83_001533 [Stemphylium lycopersici]
MAQYHHYTTFQNPKDIMRGLMAIVNSDEGDNHLSFSCVRKMSHFLADTLRKSSLPQNPTHRTRSRSRSPSRERDDRLEALRARQEERQRDYQRQLERDRETNRRAGERMREAQARFRENVRSRQQSDPATTTARAQVQLYSNSAPSSRFHGPVNCVHSFYAPAGSNILADERPLQTPQYRMETTTGQSIRTRPSDSGPPRQVDTTFYWEFESPEFQALLPDHGPTTSVEPTLVEQPPETAATNGESAGTATAEETVESTELPTRTPASPTSLDVNVSTPQHSFAAVEEQDSGIIMDDTSSMIAKPEVEAIHDTSPTIVVTDFAYNTQTTVQSPNSSPQVSDPSTQDTQYTLTSTAPLALSADRPVIDYEDDSGTGAAAASKNKSPTVPAPLRRSSRLAKAESEALPPAAENVALGKRARDDEADGANKKVLTDGDMRKLSTPRPKLR